MLVTGRLKGNENTGHGAAWRIWKRFQSTRAALARKTEIKG
jgi:hypothetical protein